MSTYTGKINVQKDCIDTSFWAAVVRIDKDGESHVVTGYKPRIFVSLMNANKSVNKYLIHLRDTFNSDVELLEI